jgi:Transmembrane family 220, helix
MKYISLTFFVIFLLFTYWQFNDPDPILWIPIYGIAAYCAFRSYQGAANKEMVLVLAFMAAAAGINSWTQMTAWEGLITEGLAMKTHNQEVAREALGLGICVVALLFFWVTAKSEK